MARPEALKRVRTFEMCQQFVGHTVLLTEDEINNGIIQLMEKRVLVEGAAGTAIAPKNEGSTKGKRVGIVICGRNISLDVLRKKFMNVFGLER